MGTVFRFVFPWRAVRTMQHIRVVHGVAHPSSAFVAEVEMFLPFLRPCRFQFFFRRITAIGFRRHHRHSGRFTEEPVASAAVFSDNLIGSSLMFVYPICSATFRRRADFSIESASLYKIFSDLSSPKTSKWVDPGRNRDCFRAYPTALGSIQLKISDPDTAIWVVRAKPPSPSCTSS